MTAVMVILGFLATTAMRVTAFNLGWDWFALPLGVGVNPDWWHWFAIAVLVEVARVKVKRDIVKDNRTEDEKEIDSLGTAWIGAVYIGVALAIMAVLHACEVGS